MSAFQPKCPYCDAVVHSVNILKAQGVVPMVQTLECITYSCQSCHKVLGVQIDPLVVKNETVRALKTPVSRKP